jgi:hypothetical protein
MLDIIYVSDVTLHSNASVEGRWPMKLNMQCIPKYWDSGSQVRKKGVRALYIANMSMSMDV